MIRHAHYDDIVEMLGYATVLKVGDKFYTIYSARPYTLTGPVKFNRDRDRSEHPQSPSSGKGLFELPTDQGMVLLDPDDSIRRVVTAEQIERKAARAAILTVLKNEHPDWRSSYGDPEGYLDGLVDDAMQRLEAEYNLENEPAPLE